MPLTTLLVCDQCGRREERIDANALLDFWVWLDQIVPADRDVGGWGWEAGVPSGHLETQKEGI